MEAQEAAASSQPAAGGESEAAAVGCGQQARE